MSAKRQEPQHAAKVFGSLVVCLPVPHTGGAMVVRHTGRKQVRQQYSGGSVCKIDKRPLSSGDTPFIFQGLMAALTLYLGWHLVYLECCRDDAIPCAGTASKYKVGIGAPRQKQCRAMGCLFVRVRV